MSGPPSHHTLPRWVDSRKFAHQGVEMEGDIPATGLPRLAQATSRLEAPAHAKLRFAVDESGYRTVSGPLHATVKLICQRCMGETELEISSEMAVAVVGSDDESKQLPKSLEPWQVSTDTDQADLYAVIEDELLLDLPMVVYHDYQCIDEALYTTGSAETAQPEKPNPFQVLEQLKDQKKK